MVDISSVGMKGLVHIYIVNLMFLADYLLALPSDLRTPRVKYFPARMHNQLIIQHQAPILDLNPQVFSR